MAIEIEKTEAEILRTLRSRYEQDGYTFVAHPTGDLVPTFLRGYLPDALALSDRGSVIIEVKSRQNPEMQKNLARIAERVEGHPDWRFEIYYAGDFQRPFYEKPSKEDISRLLYEVEGLTNANFFRAALVMSWAALEAIARGLVSESRSASGPMMPSEIVEWLSRSGYLDRPTGRALKGIIKTRNAIVHGDQLVEFDREDLHLLNSIVKRLAEELYSRQLA